MISDAHNSATKTECSRLVLLDLGLAMRLVAPGPEHDITSVTTSRDLAVGFGIIGYRAPEVHRKVPFGLAVDIFAFGRVLHNMLSAVTKPPRAWITPRKLWAQLLLAICERGPRGGWGYECVYCEPAVSARWPAELSRLAFDCLSRDPSARPSSEAISKILADCTAKALRATGH